MNDSYTLDPPETLTIAGKTDGTHGTVTITGGGTGLTYTPNPDYYGSDSFTYTITDDGTTNGVSDPLTDTATVYINVTEVNDASIVTNDRATQSVQYSDPVDDVTITATDVDSFGEDLVASASYTINGGVSNPGLPGNLILTQVTANTVTGGPFPSGDPGSAEWTVSGNMMVAPGTYETTIEVSDDSTGKGTTTFNIEVTQENAHMQFEENPVAVKVWADDKGNDEFQMVIIITQADDESPGDLSKITEADIKISFEPVGPGSGHGPVSANSFIPGTGIATFIVPRDALTVGTYTTKVTLGNEWFTANPIEDVLVVYDPSLGFTTGGGWFYWPNTTDKTNFGYTMKYNKRGEKVQGSLLLIRHMPDGSIYRVKSNVLYGLALGDEDTFGWAFFSGKATTLNSVGLI